MRRLRKGVALAFTSAELTRLTDVPNLASLTQRISHQLPLLDARRAGAELYGSPRLNAFELFRPDENRISSLIADLLDPTGTHGQGNLFVNSLLNAIGLPTAGLNDHVSIRREMPTTAKRRIDLLIETPAVLVGIENKPWAGQQPQQLRDYLDALNAWAGRKQVALIFLSDQEAKSAKGEVVVVTFADDGESPSLQTILSDSLEKIRSDRVRTHVREFITYMKTQFGDGAPVDASDEAYVEAVEAEFAGNQNRRAVAAVLLAYDTLHQTIVNEIGEHLLESLKAIYDDFEAVDDENLYDVLSNKQVSWELRRSSWPRNLSVSLEADQQYLNKVFYGVKSPDPKVPAIAAEKIGCAVRPAIEKAMKAFGGGSKTNHWAWWSWCSASYWGPEFSAQTVLHSPTGKVGDHPEITELTERMLALAAAVDVELAKS